MLLRGFTIQVGWALAALVAGCSGGEPAGPPEAAGTESSSAAVLEPEPAPVPAPVPEVKRRLTLVAGGDVSFGRDPGQALLRKPDTDFFQGVAPLFATGDLRFVNLESQLSDQRGETQSPWVKLVFTGPPEGAGALARAKVDIVSLANNHAWDYGKKALLETLDNLDRAGVAHVGTGRIREDAYAPVVIERKGVRVAFLAVTHMWNHGVLYKHPAKDFVADAEKTSLAANVRAARARADVDLVIVSYHGGVEYLDLPIDRTRAMVKAAIDAGADAVIGHHPHVAQGIEWHAGKPILYSLGNLVMQMSEGRPKVSGYVARLGFSKGEGATVEVCPLRFPEHAGATLVGHAGRALLEKRFFARLERVSLPLGGIEIGDVGEDGCANVTAGTAAVPGGASATSAPRRANGG